MSDRDTLLGLLSDPARDDTVDAPAVFAGRYRVESLIGVGGMGAVYRVYDERLGEGVALKVLKGAGPEVAARLRSEVVMARRVTHPNVVRIFDLGEDGEQLFLTMEYVEGESLGARLAREGPLDPSRALDLGRQLCSAVAAAHEAGVLHRDLKPDNVLLSTRGRAVLTDFGIAMAVAGGTELWAGTPAWMAPEQRAGAPATPRSEVWALGAILYEALTGERATEGVEPDRLPAVLAPHILRCLAEVPEHRYPSAERVGAVLAGVAADSAVPAARRLAGPSERLLHVTPIRMVGPAESAYLAEGFTEEIVDALGVSPGLSVASGPVPDPRAEAVVEGSIRWTGAGPLRVSARLVDTDQGLRIWSRKLGVEREELLDLGELMARQIASAMDQRRPERPLSGMSSDASEDFLRARAMVRENWSGDLAPAADLLLRVLERYPREPALLSLLARVRSRQAFFARSEEAPALFEAALGVAARAIEADPERGEPWLALGQALMYRGRTAEGAAALRRAVARSPGSADVHRILGYLLLEVGRPEASVHHLELAVASRSTIDAERVLGRAHAYGGDIERARKWTFRGAAEHPIDCAYQAGRLWLWGHEDLRDEARAAIVRAMDSLQPVEPGLMSSMAGALGALQLLIDEQPLGRERTEAAVVTIRADGGGRLRSARCQFVAELACWVGHLDLALDAVEIAGEVGLEDLTWMDRCPPLAALRDQPRFLAVRDAVAARAAGIVAALDGDEATEAALDALVRGTTTR